MGLSSPAAAEEMARGLCGLIEVVYTSLDDVVARLDQTPRGWLLTLDIDSPPEDHCWAMVDVLKMLALGPGAVERAVPARALRVVR